MVLCWVIWCAVHCVVLVVLVIMSSFTVLPSIPARIILHIICALVSVLSGLVMIRSHIIYITSRSINFDINIFANQNPRV